LADAGGQARMLDANLAGPSGPVDIRTVDNTTGQLGAYLPTGGVIVPAAALAPGTTYRASATLDVGGRVLSRHWSFTTALADPSTMLFVAPTVSLDASTQPPTITQGTIGVRTTSPAPVHVTVTSGGQELGSHNLAGGDSWTPPQVPGTVQVCGHQDATSYYRGFDGCQPLLIRDQASFTHPTLITITARFAGPRLRYRIEVHPPAGRKVTLTARRLVGAAWRTYRIVVRKADRILTRSIRARPSFRAVQVQVSVPGVRTGAEVYRAARIVRTIRR
jgi:hypothetical protein